MRYEALEFFNREDISIVVLVTPIDVSMSATFSCFHAWDRESLHADVGIVKTVPKSVNMSSRRGA